VKGDGVHSDRKKEKHKTQRGAPSTKFSTAVHTGLRCGHPYYKGAYLDSGILLTSFEREFLKETTFFRRFTLGYSLPRPSCPRLYYQLQQLQAE
jgi:hypothetical protein